MKMLLNDAYSKAGTLYEEALEALHGTLSKADAETTRDLMLAIQDIDRVERITNTVCTSMNDEERLKRIANAWQRLLLAPSTPRGFEGLASEILMKGTDACDDYFDLEVIVAHLAAERDKSPDR